MRTARLACAALVWIGLHAVAADAQSAGDVLTLDRAVELALASNRPVKAAALDEARAADASAALRTRRLPALDLKAITGGVLSPIAFSFRQGVFGTYPGIGPVPFADLSVKSPRAWSTGLLFSAVQPLTQLRTIGIGARLLDLGRDLAAEKTRGARQSVVADVRRAYYGLQQVRAGLAAVGQGLAELEELERVVGHYVQSQTALPGNLLAVRTERARAEHTRLVLRDREATLKEQLNLLMGRDLATPFDVAPLGESVPEAADVGAAVARARTERPAVREAELTVRRAALDLERRRSERTPEVSLGFHYLRLFNLDVLPRNVAAASVIVSWEPWDWGRRRLEARAGERALEQAKLGLAEAQARVEVDVRAKARALAEAAQALDVARLARETAADWLRVATDWYRADATLFKDQLEAQTAMAKADQEYQQALAGYWTARADFEQARGDQP